MSIDKVLKESNNLIGPMIQKNAIIANMTPEEKTKYLKLKYGLRHGKGKRKKKNKK